MLSFDQACLRLPRGARADAALAGGVFVLVALAEGSRLSRGGESIPSLAVSWLLITTVCGALLFRRRYPVAVGWSTVVATGVYYLLSDIDAPLIVVPVLALYAIAAQGRMRAVVAMAAAMVSGVSVGALSGNGDVNGTAVFMLTGWLVAVVALGSVRHGRVVYTEEEARLRATEEGLRIARELHDVIGHNISLINVQAGAALHRLRKDPAQAGEALGAIKASSREALRELRATLGVLRQVDEEAPTASAPGLARADELVASAKLAGLSARIERMGAERTLPAPVELAAYRIMRESLTNAAKHSGTARVTIRLVYGDGELTVAVEDEGRGPAARWAGTGGGSGIVGMTERARALGGELTAGPRPEGGFAVRARLPYGTDRVTEFEHGMPQAHQAWDGNGWRHDPAVIDDQALIINVRGRGLVIITGCGHAGVVNIIRHAMMLTGVSKLLALIGGFHLSGPAFEPVIGPTTAALTELAPELIVPGHCTGWRAQHTLAAALPDAWVQTSVGTTCTLSAPQTVLIRGKGDGPG